MVARLEPVEAVASLTQGQRVLVGGASGESTVFAEAVMASADHCRATFVGIFVPGLNRTTYLPNAECRVETFFMTPELAGERERVDFRPLCYRDLSDRLAMGRFDAAMMMVSPPDERGRCSFGPSVDFLAELWPSIPFRIAHINPAVPRTQGDPGIPLDALDMIFEREAPLLGSVAEESDAVTDRIAGHVAPFVPDGATLQTGLGKVPGAILRALADHRDLRIHSGLVGDAVLDLIAAGSLADGNAVTAGVAIGSPRLYAAIGEAPFTFRPVSHTHSSAVIGAIPRFVSINSVLEVDLFGQGYAEVGPCGALSGPGGATDFARGARLSPGGLRIVALPADAVRGTQSRIVAPGAARGPVSLGRFDIDIVVTEHGAADLRGLGLAGRAAALIAIAAPDHREHLGRGWAACSGLL